jgi:elongation factor P--(R)-beta-lysine ligase
VSAVERRVAVAELLPDAPLEAVEVGGRVALVGPSGFRLEHDAAAIAVTCAERLELGTWASVHGRWTGRELIASAVDVLATPGRDLARADSDFAWGRAGGIAALHERHAALRAIREFFDGAGFVEVETPAVVRSPGLELHLDALEVLGCGGPRWLHTSPEYHMKRLLSAGMSRLYQVCKAYRRDERGNLHQPEFTMLEWYRAFAGSEQLMSDTEQLVAHVARRVHGSTRIPGLHGELDVTPPWERLQVSAAFARYAGRDVHELLADDEAFYRTLVDDVEPKLGRGKPTFLTHYPARMAALARVHPDDPTTADRFEAYAHGLELCNGFGELTDPVEQRRRFEADLSARALQDRPSYPIDERFLDALTDGLPPCAGNALGVDRLLMLILGKHAIADVVAFSTDRA